MAGSPVCLACRGQVSRPSRLCPHRRGPRGLNATPASSLTRGGARDRLASLVLMLSARSRRARPRRPLAVVPVRNRLDGRPPARRGLDIGLALRRTVVAAARAASNPTPAIQSRLYLSHNLRRCGTSRSPQAIAGAPPYVPRGELQETSTWLSTPLLVADVFRRNDPSLGGYVRRLIP